MPPSLSILIAEDDPADAALLIRQFKQAGYEVTSERVQTADAFAEALKRHHWDLILADSRMPQFTGIDALHLVRESGQDIPFIIVSGTIGEEAAAEIMRAGAHDYFQKGHYARLVQSAEREIREADERARRRSAERNLEFLIEAGKVLSSSLDYAETLANVTRLVVPALADWCAVYFADQGTTRQGALLHSDPRKVVALREINGGYLADPQSDICFPKVLRTGASEFYPQVTGDLITRMAPNPAHASFTQSLNLRSYLCVPIKARNQVFGAITFATDDSGRTYDSLDLALAEAFAERASVAIENALLYREAAEQREWFEVTLSSIGDAVIATNTQGQVTFMNAIAQTLTGWSFADAQGKPLSDIFEIVNEDTGQRVENPVAKVLSTGAIVGLANHTILIDRNGRQWPIDDSAAPIRDKQGNLIGVVMVFHDVSNQRGAERQVRESEERYRAFIENSTEGIWRFDLERPVSTSLPVGQQIDLFFECGFLAECNDAMARMYGYHSAAEIVGARLSDLMPRESPENIAYLSAFVEAGYRLTNAESHELDREGHPRHFMNNLVGTLLDSHITGAWGIQRDVTELRHSRVQLEESFRRTRHLYELSRRISTTHTHQEVLEALLSSHLLQTAQRATVLWFDHPWTADQQPLYGDVLATWSRDAAIPDVTGRRFNFDEYHTLNLISRTEPVIIANVAADERIDGPARTYLDEMGTKSYVTLPLVATGQFFGILTVHWDVHDAVSMDEARYLQGISDQAAAAIYNLRILEQEALARRQAEEADALKMKFLAMISHELRTPLTSIKGFISTLLSPDVRWSDEQQLEFHQIINVETDNLADLVEQLLDLSRLEAGTLRINRERVTPQQMIDAALPKVTHLCVNHTLKQEIADSLPPVLADRRRVVQVISNLVDNACKYSPEGSDVTLSVQHVDGFVRFTVRDQGPGIPLEDRDLVFEAFRQAGNRPQHESRGAGLGLAIAQALIEAHEGRIWIEDTPDRGTTISFTIPAIKE